MMHSALMFFSLLLFFQTVFLPNTVRIKKPKEIFRIPINARVFVVELSVHLYSAHDISCTELYALKRKMAQASKARTCLVRQFVNNGNNEKDHRKNCNAKIRLLLLLLIDNNGIVQTFKSQFIWTSILNTPASASICPFFNTNFLFSKPSSLWEPFSSISLPFLPSHTFHVLLLLFHPDY